MPPPDMFDLAPPLSAPTKGDCSPSIHHPLRVDLLILALLIAPLMVSSRAETDSGQRVSGTPYDRYMGPLRRVYARLGNGDLSIDEVRAQLRIGRRFRYAYDSDEPYTPTAPALTEARQSGDCKAKALWLARQVGDRRAHYCMGRLRTSDRVSHAWLLWRNDGEWLILDPTWETEVASAERAVGRRWFARYSYNGSGSYVHPTYQQYVHD